MFLYILSLRLIVVCLENMLNHYGNHVVRLGFRYDIWNHVVRLGFRYDIWNMNSLICVCSIHTEGFAEP